MKTIKVKFVGFWEDLKDYTYLDVYHILSKYYQVEICEDADYVICSCFGEPYEFCRHPQIRIMISEENYIPDFNLVDYAISPYSIQYYDRSFCLPVCVKPTCTPQYDHAVKIESRPTLQASDLKDKPFFANFIYSHESDDEMRGTLFRELSAYKRVESAGKYLNNMPGGQQVSLWSSSKTDLQKKCKFTLAVESTVHNGFVTEKITDAFYANTIPIYYGSEAVKDIFNPKAFLYCGDFPTTRELMEYIKEIDQNDALFLDMINQPVYRNEGFASQTLRDLEAYLKHIFDQPLQTARRRSRSYSPKRYEDYILAAKNAARSPVKQMVKKTFARINTRIKATFKRK